MTLKVGEKVRYLNEVGGGVITKILDSQMVEVEDNSGFSMPMKKSELIIDAPMQMYVPTRRYTPEKEVDKKKEEILEDDPEVDFTQDFTKDEEDGDDFELYLGIVPINKEGTTDSGADLYFINDSSFRCLYTISKLENLNNVSLIDKGDLEPDTKKHIVALSTKELHAPQTLIITLIPYKYRKHTLQLPEQINIDLNPIKFVKQSAFTENDFFEEKAFIYKVVSTKKEELKIVIDPKELEQAMQNEKKTSRARISKPETKVELEEVDLHIEKLLDDYKSLSNSEIVDIQMSRFQTALELGIQAGTKRMVFIHGVGNGKLKHEIRKTLDSNYSKKLNYQDASFKEYGYGATMVILK